MECKNVAFTWKVSFHLKVSQKFQQILKTLYMQNSSLDDSLASWKVLVFAEIYLKAFLYIENMLSKVVFINYIPMLVKLVLIFLILIP